jgi:hypothetical protein
MDGFLRWVVWAAAMPRRPAGLPGFAMTAGKNRAEA